MKYTKRSRKGFVVMVMLVMIGLLTAFSTSLLTQIVLDRERQESRINRSQRQLLEADMARTDFKKRFDGQTGPVFASFYEVKTNQRHRYDLVVDPRVKPVSTTIQSNQFKGVNPKAL